jgi:hypothetical protein
MTMSRAVACDWIQLDLPEAGGPVTTYSTSRHHLRDARDCGRGAVLFPR